MYRSLTITGVTFLLLLGMSAPDVLATSGAYRPFTSRDLQGPRRVSDQPIPTLRELNRSTRERERLFFEERIQALQDGDVRGHRLRIRQLRKELKRFE